MNREPVTSSNLAAVGYDEATKTLEVEFKNGTIYEYYSVPMSVYAGLMSAPSAGKYFNAHVKDAGFRFRQIR